MQMSIILESNLVFESTNINNFFDRIIDISEFNFGVESDWQGIIGR